MPNRSCQWKIRCTNFSGRHHNKVNIDTASESLQAQATIQKLLARQITSLEVTCSGSETQSYLIVSNLKSSYNFTPFAIVIIICHIILDVCHAVPFSSTCPKKKGVPNGQSSMSTLPDLQLHGAQHWQLADTMSNIEKKLYKKCETCVKL